MKGPRILLWDIETSHNLVAAFQLKQQDYLPSENILQERFIICAAWKELDAPTVHCVAVSRRVRGVFDDRPVVTRLHDVLANADVLVAHNGDQFDLKFVEGRMLHHGLRPLPPIPTVDTLKVARDRFLFNANNLDYLGKFLGVGRKKPTTSGLWLRVLAGDRQAVKEMVEYNKQDVLLLERVYKKLSPYAKTSINRGLFADDSTCPRCGKDALTKQGTRIALTQRYVRYQCTACGGWCRDRKAAGGTSKRVL